MGREAAMANNIERLARVLTAGFVVVAVALAYWQLVRAPELVAREDNPRLVRAEWRVQRGRLLDRQGAVLAVSEPAAVPGVRDAVRRRYPHPETVPVAGYYSLRYGSGGSEAVFDSVLRGTQSQIEQLLHRPPRGADVSLTLVLHAQQAAGQALGDRRGAVVVMSTGTGDILVMVSHPVFDPNRLDEEWDALVDDPAAPLLNRSTQGVYPLGDLARWVAMAGLLSAGITTPADPYGAPLEEFMAPLSPMGYLATARQLSFDAPPPIALPASAGRLPEFARRGTPRDLAATPLHMARFVAAVVSEGRMPVPRLTDSPDIAVGDLAFASAVAKALHAAMPIRGELAGWTGVARPLETGSEPVSWFVGYAVATSPPLVVAVVVEDSGDGADAVLVAQQAMAAMN
jgi:cell division protein FtsI/penicillin-binding protein 2